MRYALVTFTSIRVERVEMFASHLAAAEKLLSYVAANQVKWIANTHCQVIDGPDIVNYQVKYMD